MGVAVCKVRRTSDATGYTIPNHEGKRYLAHLAAGAT
jgi:hypothetical protein